MRKIKGLLRLTNVLLYTAVVLFVACTAFQRAGRKEKERMLAYYPQKILEKAGIRCFCEGEKFSASEGSAGCLVVSNHISWLDIFSLNSQLPCRFIAKAEIAKWPVFGIIARAIGTLFIDRTSKRAIVRINEKINEALCAKEAVAVFAEGTTTFGNQLLELKCNFLAPACECETVVQPLIVSYAEKGVPTKKAAFAGDVSLFGSIWNVATMEEGSVTLHFLEPICNPSELTRHEIGEICEQRMKAKLREIWGPEYAESDSSSEEILARAIEKGAHKKPHADSFASAGKKN